MEEKSCSIEWQYIGSKEGEAKPRETHETDHPVVSLPQLSTVNRDIPHFKPLSFPTTSSLYIAIMLTAPGTLTFVCNTTSPLLRKVPSLSCYAGLPSSFS